MAETSPKAMLEKLWEFDNDCQCKIILFMWCWWSARNKKNSGEKKRNAKEVINDVLFHFQAWRDAVHVGKCSSPLVDRPKQRAPPKDVYKINFDGAFIPGLNKAGWGFIIRDHYGQVIAGAGSTDFVLLAYHAEAIACLKGLEQAAILGMGRDCGDRCGRSCQGFI